MKNMNLHPVEKSTNSWPVAHFVNVCISNPTELPPKESHLSFTLTKIMTQHLYPSVFPCTHVKTQLKRRKMKCSPPHSHKATSQACSLSNCRDLKNHRYMIPNYVGARVPGEGCKGSTCTPLAWKNHTEKDEEIKILLLYNINYNYSGVSFGANYCLNRNLRRLGCCPKLLIV